MKKLSISLLAVISAFIGAANAASIGMSPSVSSVSYTSTSPASPQTISGWGTSTSVGEAWGTTARGYTISQTEIDGEYMETGLCIIGQSSNSNAACASKTDAQECGYVDENGCTYEEPQVIARKDYQLNLATDTLFRDVLNDLEKEAQAKYNAKLTAEQNMCIAANSGGIMGRGDMSGTYRWAKLNKRKVPTDYATSGLTNKDFTVSNDLYGSFCAARVTIQSDDADIQAEIRKDKDKDASWATRYFAVGDVFTCGSWIPQNRLEEIAKGVADKKQEGKHRTQLSTSQKWWAAGATILGAGAFGAGADLLQTGSGLGGLLGTKKSALTPEQETAKRSWENAQALFNSSTACDGTPTTQNKKFKYGLAGQYEGVLLKNYNTISDSTGDSCQDVYDYITQLTPKISSFSSSVDRSNTRRWVDIGAGAVGGLGTLLATVETMKATNREAYDAETRQIIDEFMANVGSHIFCFIGAEEAGTFGDLVEVSME